MVLLLTKRFDKSQKSGILVTNLEGTILYCNEEAQHIFGYSAQELLGQKPALLYPDRDEMQLAPDLQAILNGKDFFGEWLGRRKDDTQVWVEIKTTVLHDSKGEPRGFIEVAEDITDRKQVEGALHLQQQEFQAIAEHAPDIIARFDAVYRFLYVNPAIEVATGLPPHSFIGKNWEKLVCLLIFQRFGRAQCTPFLRQGKNLSSNLGCHYQ